MSLRIRCCRPGWGVGHEQESRAAIQMHSLARGSDHPGPGRARCRRTHAHPVEAEDPATAAEIDPERSALAAQSERFWTEFLDVLKLDDPEQPKPRPARLGYITFPLPARTSWLTVYRGVQPGRVGVFLSSWRNTPGGNAMQAIVKDWDAVKDELGGTAKLSKTTRGTLDTIIDSLQVGSLEQPEVRKKAFAWLAERVNTFVNVLRPRMRSLAADYQSRGK